MTSPFQKLAQKKYSQDSESIRKNPYKSPFEQLVNSPKYIEKNSESFWKNAFRSALQIPQGIAEVTPSGIATNLWHLLGMGAVLDPEEIENIRNISEREGIPFDEEAYMEAAENALKYVPTVSNIAKGIEEKTGLPLEPKTALQKGVRLGTAAGKFQPGTIAQKGTAAVVAPTTSALLQEAGMPEFLADITGLGAGGLAGTKTPKIDLEKVKTPSGLTVKQYEKLEQPISIPEKKIKSINKSLENEFRNIASDIIEKSPIEETYTTLKEDSSFKMAAEEAFEKVDQLAESIPDKIETKDLLNSLKNRSERAEKKGITPLEFDKVYHKFIREFIKDTKEKETGLSGLVKQYRKNNEAYGKSWESGQSTDYNIAKREALLDYNRSIAETIEKNYPHTEFSNLFKSSNETWKKIMDAEAIDAYMNDIFEGKIHFQKAGELFKNKKMQQSFKRSLGEKGFADFKQLSKDLMDKQKAHAMLEVAEKKGYENLVKTGASYLMHPKIAYAKIGWDIAKSAYKKLWEAVLDKPQLMVTWDKGVKAFKKGDFSNAEIQFEKLKTEVELVNSREKAFKEFREIQKSKTEI